MELYSFDPLSVGDEFFEKHAGITINGVIWPCAATAEEIVGRSLILTPDDQSELSESVFWELGITLEINHLELACLSLSSGNMTIRVKAQLVNPEDGRDLTAEGVLVANVVFK